MRQRQKPIRIVEGGTLRLAWPAGQTLGLAVLVLALIAGICEGLARATLARSNLLSHSVAGGHDHLGAKLAALDRLVEEEGGVDCIFLGSSMTEWGIDPDVFSAAYEAQTDERIRCFNFALLGVTTSEAAAWAEVLTQEYHPRLFIYPASARDYSERVALPVVVTPWVDYRLGAFSPEGWLVEHSLAYRYYLTHDIWTQPNYQRQLRRRARLEAEMYARRGFEAKSDVTDVSIPPDPEDFPLIRESLVKYRVSPEDVEGLKRMAGLREQGASVLLVEAPLPATYMTFFGGGEQDYARFVEVIGGHAEAAGVPFWRAPPDLIPGDGWADYGHLNQEGAEVFSEWLGARVGEAVRAGAIPAPTS